MSATALLIVLLSNQGYWFGGGEGEVALKWNIENRMPPAVFEWELMADKLRLANGRAELPVGKEPHPIRLTLPGVRVRTGLRLIYRVKSAAELKELIEGEMNIELFPRELFANLQDRIRGKLIYVLDGPKGLTLVLKNHKIPHTAIENPAKVPLAKPDIILVGVDQLNDEHFEQSRLMDQAEAGASIIIFQQTKSRTLAGYPFTERRGGNKTMGGAPPLEFKLTHTLLQGFEEHDIQRLIEHMNTLRMISLPADEPVLELIFSSRETPGREPVPIDALLVTKSVGKGRVVLCQLPLGDWMTDPRSQLFLVNAFDYLLTRPEPTPRPSARVERRVLQPTAVPSILTPSGANP